MEDQTHADLYTELGNYERILDVALRLFALEGYEAVGVQTIAETAGITKPTLYHYFGSKQGLLDALILRYDDKIFARVKKAAIYEHDIVLTLERIAFEYLACAREMPQYFRMRMAMSWAAPDGVPAKRVGAAKARFREMLEELFKNAAQDHGNMRNREVQYAATLIGVLDAYADQELNSGSSLDDSAIRKAVHQYMHGIFS